MPNAIGRLIAINDEMGRTEYAYDAHGRITDVTFTPPGGTTTSLASSIGYAPFGPTNALTFGNGIMESRTFDTAGRLDVLTSSVLALDYVWDATDNIIGITDSLDATRSQSFDYDALYRLTDASGVYGSFKWSYDAVGNRLSEAVIPVQTGIQEMTTYTYAATSNRLDTITDASGIVTYQYDANGNTLADGGNTFVYDDRNRLVEAVNPATQLGVGDYGHNALGQRVVKITASGTVLFAYDEAGHLLGEYDATGNAIRQYVWLGDRPVAMLKPNGATIDVYYIHSDHLNTPKVVTDQSQAVVWSADYGPFGDVTETVAAVEMNLRFPGQYEDEETGLNYNYFRSYNSATGRYTQSDPIELLGGLNLYAYVDNQPTKLVDPTGLFGAPSDHHVPSPEEIRKMQQRSCTRKAFSRAYHDMREANWKNSDKYFHCRANCDATRCGPAGEEEACTLSDFREIFDQLIKGDSKEASDADQAANRYGRRGANNSPNKSCQTVCSAFRPKGLPSEY